MNINIEKVVAEKVLEQIDLQLFVTAAQKQLDKAAKDIGKLDITAELKAYVMEGIKDRDIAETAVRHIEYTLEDAELLDTNELCEVFTDLIKRKLGAIK